MKRRAMAVLAAFTAGLLLLGLARTDVSADSSLRPRGFAPLIAADGAPAPPTPTPTPTRPAPPPEPAATPPPQGISNSGGIYYTDSIGWTHVVGMVTNNTSAPIEYVEVTARFYDASSILIAVDTTYVSPGVLNPGARGLFETLTQLPGKAARVEALVTNYDIADNYALTDSQLTAQKTNYYTDSIGYGHMVGTVRNNTSRTLTYVEVRTGFLRSDGSVVTQDFTFSKPETLGPGQQGTFEILLMPHAGFDPKQTGSLKYVLLVDAS